ncbi:methionyl-tRNA formyltransferase [Cesiribacter andamanensis]|uniref:Methionyl-tRNA formyltransferase n=1 Tax=Cesiribacter andamanensis AMV16 TaxID=1279009 RepID=M7N8B4_9BACT|nr:methionyl-tRNA formyltransferase [Cesiribacter andamanensis]EMR04823.1 Methionyl-tRNA formyltransferase [Cesiribacter andamanensis AMV16]
MDLRIVFIGTPEFAVPSLQLLVEQGFSVVGVVTAPDKPKGRGQKVIPSPVKEYALSQGLHVLQPTNLKSLQFLEELRSLQANLQIVVAFRMLPEAVWAMPVKGTFNLHASLLPQYRGAAPINWALINGETETGVTTFFLKHEIDTGSIIFQEREEIRLDDDAGSLYTRLMQKGSWLVLRTVQAIAANTVVAQPQPESAALKHAPKIFKETCQINWQLPAGQLYNFVRGLSPYPAAWTELQGKNLKIYKATLTGKPAPDKNPGEWLSDGRHLYCKAADELLQIEELQLEGKRRMSTEEFLRGFHL